MLKISNNQLQEMKEASNHNYFHKDNSHHLRERFAFPRDENMFVLVEGNTSGFFLVNDNENLQESNYWVNQA